ncbi:2528_t:CDS:2 [Acaulospora colombiana]|uniref:2528_t:CDS:1 n=1 Tax=Acaulospora colombiana TaxID=27376 RepID=A0ACA9NVB6_9GLOM|nr:2528_t:CDS:2 [Acaulospora colombiana]
MRILQQFNNPVHSGAITSMCLDKGRTWVVAGSVTGLLSLWDIRFGLLLKTWKAGSTTQPGANLRVHQCANHPVNKQWVIVASETRSTAQSDGGSILVEVWDLEKATIVETLVTRDVSIPSHGQAPALVTSAPVQQPTPVSQSPADAISQLVQSRNAQASTKGSNPERYMTESDYAPCDIRSLAVGIDFGGQGSTTTTRDGFVLTGGFGGLESRHKDLGYVLLGSEDRKLRLWYLGQGQLERTIRSNVDSPPSHTEIWSHYDAKEREKHRSTARPSLIGHYQQTLLKSHQDCITAIACIDSPFRGGVVSADRSGVIKVYRVSESE